MRIRWKRLLLTSLTLWLGYGVCTDGQHEFVL